MTRPHPAAKTLHERMLFVYSQRGTIQCYSFEELWTEQATLIESGWRHTATIDPARWIESLANGTCLSEMLDEIRSGIP